MNLHRHWYLVLLAVFSVFVFFYDLNATYLTNWDEAWHAAMARQMARTNDFVTPYYNGEVWYATAPLYLWLVAIWFQFTNYSIIGVRFFSALAGLGTIFLTYAIGARIKNRSVGFISAFILATTIQFLFRSRQGNLDAPLTFFTTLAVYCFLRGKQAPRWFVGVGMATAFGFLTKNILGLFPLGLLWLMPKKDAFKSLIIFGLLSLPWHILAFARHDFAFINHYFLQYAFTKVTSTASASDTDWWWYGTVLKHGLKFWVLLLPIALIANLKYMVTNSSIRILFFWFGIPFISLSLSSMRSDWYILSLYPAITLLIALGVDEIVSWLSKKIGLNKDTSLKLLIMGIGVVGIINLLKYQSSVFVPDTTAAEAQLAQKARDLSTENEMILLDDTYLPVAVFYADRQVLPVRRSRSFESLVLAEKLHQATMSGVRLVLTNDQTKSQLLNRLNHPNYLSIQKIHDKELIRLEY